MSDPRPKSYQRFFAELKRRHVFRVTALYGIVGFIILQVVDLAVPALLLPEWTYRLVALLLLVGFPVAVIITWAFEITPEGIRKTESADPEEIEAITAQPASRRWPAGLLALLGVAALVAGAWWVGRQGAPGGDGASEDGGLIRSLAVLPLDNLTGDEARAYFVDGMHDALIGQLARIDGLTVLSRTSTLRYRETDKTMGDIAEELGVEGLVEGSVFRAGDTVRITVQLVRGSPEEHLWTEEYVDEISSALSLHGRVARSIARQIQLTLNPREAARLAEARDVDPEAQDAYLRGRALWRTRQLDNLERAVKLLEEAVARDPDFALAYAGLADAYLMHAVHGGVQPDNFRNAYDRTREAATRALELEPELPEPHATLGWVAMVDDLDWTEAENRIRRSLELTSSYAHGWDLLGDVLGVQGRISEGMRAMRRALELDPFSPAMHRNLAIGFYNARQYDVAVEHLERALELDPAQGLAWWFLAQCSLARGDEEKALDYFARTVPPEAATAVRDAYEASGWEGVSRWNLERTDHPFVHARALVHLRRYDEAVAALRTGYEQRNPLVTLTVKPDPVFDPLRDRPDFQALLTDMGLAD